MEAPKMKIYKIPDYMRLSGKIITVRFDPNDVVTLSCHCKYDPALDKKVRLLRKVEVQREDGTWEPYPSVVWIDAGEVLITRALVKITGENEISVMSSPNGVPDGELMTAAEEAGIYTETLDIDMEY
jgi:hypothetical protein